MSDLNVAVLQLTSSEDPAQNQSAILKSLEGLGEPELLDAIFLPENSLFIRVDPDRNHIDLEMSDPIYEPFLQFCRQFKCHMLFGSNPVKTKNGVENATVWIQPSGLVSMPYSKIHLFDVNVDGQKPIRESDDFFAGVDPSVIDICGWKVGLSVCYDIRFPELYLQYAKQSVDLITIPAAFLQKTGEAHWHTLQRARAIESQAFVVSAAQTGTHKSKTGKVRMSYGHSLIIGPWGEIIHDMGTDVGVSQATLSKAKTKLVRTQIPVSSHRKL